MPKTNAVATVDWAGPVMAIRFADDAKTLVQVNIDDLPENIQARAAKHGLEQKFRDSYAGVKGDVEVAISAVGKVLETLTSGVWTSGREKGGEREEPIDILAQAFVAQLQELADAGAIPIESVVTIEQARARLDGPGKKALRDSLRRTPEMQVAIAKLKAAKSKAPSLAELMAQMA